MDKKEAPPPQKKKKKKHRINENKAYQGTANFSLQIKLMYH